MYSILSHIRTSKSTRGRYIDLPYNITNSQSNFSVGSSGVFSKYIWTIELDASRRFIQEKFSRRDNSLIRISREDFFTEVKTNNHSRFFKSIKVNGVLQSGMAMQIPKDGNLWNAVPHSYDSAAFEEFELGSHGSETLVRMCMDRGKLQGFNIQDFNLSVKLDHLMSPAIFKYAKGSPEVPIYIAFFDGGVSVENLLENKTPTADPRLTASLNSTGTITIGGKTRMYSFKRGASFQISHAAFKGKYFDHNHLPFRAIKTETRTIVHISNSLWASNINLDGETNRIILDVRDLDGYFNKDYAQYISYTEAFFEPKVLTDSDDPHVSQISLDQHGVHRRYDPLTRFHGMPTISVVESVTHALVPVKLTKLLAADFIGLNNFGIGNGFQINLGPLIYVTYSNDNLNIVIEVDSAIGDVPDRVVINSVTSVKDLYKVVEMKVRCEYIVKDGRFNAGYGREGLPAIIEYICSEADFTDEFKVPHYDFLFGIVSMTSKCYERGAYRPLVEADFYEIPYRRFDDFEYLNIYAVLKHVLPNLPLKISRREWWNNGVKIFETSDANFPDRI